VCQVWNFSAYFAQPADARDGCAINLLNNGYWTN
jgi:hypothetical protein